MSICFLCDKEIEEEGNYHSINSRHFYVCPTCLEEKVSRCRDCNDLVFSDEMSEAPDGNYCYSCFNKYFTTCESCSEVIDRDDACNYRHTTYCRSCFDESYFFCESCGETYPLEELSDDEYDSYCIHCHPRYEYKPSLTFKKNIYRRKIGFELEFFSSVCPNLNKFGIVHGDGSLSGPCTGREFSSNIYNGDKLLEVIKIISKELHLVNAEINKSCGFHVHLDVTDLSDESRKNIAEWWQLFEKIFFSFVSESRRGNSYCDSVDGLTYGSFRWRNHRYTSLNISAFEKHGTFEIRIHQGTTDANKIISWIILLLSFFETFRYIDSEAIPKGRKLTIKQHIYHFSDRKLLAFFFKQLDVRGELRKYFLKRLKEFGPYLVMKKRIGRMTVPKIEMNTLNETHFVERN